MKTYKYYERDHERLIAESKSPITFNAARFPRWKCIKPVIEEIEEAVQEETVAEEATVTLAKGKKKIRKKEKEYK